MSEKKVVMVIVEGPSDENALGGILKEYFSSERVQFKVVHGDITADANTTADTVVNKIDDMIDKVRNQYGYEWQDITRIIHLTNTDGTFTKGCVKEAAVNGILYFVDHMESADITGTEQRNKHKSEILFKLYTTTKLHKTIPYKIFFNSCNLEHVLYNELKDFSDEEKERLSDDFSDKYEGKVQDFIEFISASDVAIPGSYKETWKYIETDKHSLERHSNMHLIFGENCQ